MHYYQKRTLQIALNSWFCLKDLKKTLLKVHHLQSDRNFQFHLFQNQLATVTVSPSLMDPLGPNTTSQGKWGAGRVSGLTLTLGEPKVVFFKIIISKTGAICVVPFFFAYMQRLVTRDVQNAVLVFSPTDDLNDPSPLRGQRWLQPPNKKHLSLFICLASSSSWSDHIEENSTQGDPLKPVWKYFSSPVPVSDQLV